MKQSKMKSMLSRCGMAAPVGMAAGLLMLLSVATAQAQTCVAPTVLPSCAAGEVLTSRGGALSCVAGGGLGGKWSFSQWNGIEKTCFIASTRTGYLQGNSCDTGAADAWKVSSGNTNGVGMGWCAKVANGLLYLRMIGYLGMSNSGSTTDTGWWAWSGLDTESGNMPFSYYASYNIAVRSMALGYVNEANVMLYGQQTGGAADLTCPIPFP